MSEKKSAGRGIAALLALSLLWGSNWAVMKIALRDVGPIAFAAMRNGLGAVALFAVLLALHRATRPVGWRGLIVLGLLQTTGQVGLATWALTAGGAGKVAVLVYTMPFWVVLLAWPLLGERIVRLQWVALTFGLVGIVAIVDPRTLGGASLGSDLLAIGSGVCWALGSIVAKRLRLQGDVLNITAWQMLFGSIPLVVLAVLIPERAIFWSANFTWALAYNVVPATALAWVLWMFALRNLKASVAAMGSLLNPIVGVGVAWLVLGDRPGGLEFAGIATIAIALLVVSFGPGRGATDARAKPDVQSARV